MYKIVLNNLSIVDMVIVSANYYTEDIEDFQRLWFQLEESEHNKNSFIKKFSKI